MNHNKQFLFSEELALMLRGMKPDARYYYHLDLIPPVAAVRLYKVDGKIVWYWLSKVYVRPQFRGKGLFYVMMDEIKSKISVGEGILMKPEPFGEYGSRLISLEKLISIYRAVGFKPHLQGEYYKYIKH